MAGKKMKKRIYLFLCIFCGLVLPLGGIYLLKKTTFQNILLQRQKSKILHLIAIIYGYPQEVSTMPVLWDAVVELANTKGAESWINIILLDSDFFRTYDPNPKIEEQLKMFARGKIAPLLENIPENIDKAVLWVITAQLREKGYGRFSREEGWLNKKHMDGITPPIQDIARNVLYMHLGVDHEYNVQKWRDAILDCNDYSSNVKESNITIRLVREVRRNIDFQNRLSAALKLAGLKEAGPWITVILLDYEAFGIEDPNSETSTDKFRSQDRTVIATIIANIPTQTDKEILWAITTHLNDKEQGALPDNLEVFSLVEHDNGHTRPIREIARDVLKKHLGVDHEYDVRKWRRAIIDYKY